MDKIERERAEYASDGDGMRKKEEEGARLQDIFHSAREREKEKGRKKVDSFIVGKLFC
jgi:hypothetical protein